MAVRRGKFGPNAVLMTSSDSTSSADSKCAFCGERPQYFLAGSRPVAMHVRLRRICPLRNKQDIPRQLAVRECGGFARNPACGAAIIFENDKRKWGTSAGSLLDDRRDRVVRQFPLQRGLPIVVIAIRERWAKQRLHRGKRHGLNAVNNRAAELAQRLQDAFPICNIAAIARDHCNQRRTIRTVKKSGVCRQFVGSRRHVITEMPDHINGLFARIKQKATQDRCNRMSLEFETT